MIEFVCNARLKLEDVRLLVDEAEQVDILEHCGSLSLPFDYPINSASFEIEYGLERVRILHVERILHNHEVHLAAELELDCE